MRAVSQILNPQIQLRLITGTKVQIKRNRMDLGGKASQNTELASDQPQAEIVVAVVSQSR